MDISTTNLAVGENRPCQRLTYMKIELTNKKDIAELMQSRQGIKSMTGLQFITLVTSQCNTILNISKT